MIRFNNFIIFNIILFLLIEYCRLFFFKLMLMFGCVFLNVECWIFSFSVFCCVRFYIFGWYCDGMECVLIIYKGLKMFFVWSSEL